MIVIDTQDGRRLCYDNEEQVAVLGMWGTPGYYIRHRPVGEVLQGDWIDIGPLIVSGPGHRPRETRDLARVVAIDKPVQPGQRTDKPYTDGE